MKMTNIAISTANRQQLIDFTVTVLGLAEPAANVTKTALIADIRNAGWDKDFITVAGAEEPRPTEQALPPAMAEAPGQTSRALSPGNYKTHPLVELTIAEAEGPEGKRPVFVGCNGVGIRVPRNRKCTIPEPYYHVLADAKQELHEQEENGDITSRSVPRHNITVHRFLPPETTPKTAEKAA